MADRPQRLGPVGRHVARSGGPGASAPLRTPYAGFAGAGRGFGSVIHPLLPGSRMDWAREALDPALNSTVAACLGWLQDNFPSARLQVLRRKADGTEEPVPDHGLMALLGPAGRPNRAYSRRAFWSAMLRAWKVDGNAYAILWRGAGGFGPPAELWWEPPGNVLPWRAQDSPNLVDRYYVRRPTGLYELDPSDVLHLRDGIDPYNPMLGCARLRAALRLIVGLNRAETYTAAILGNGGITKLWVPESTPGLGGVVDEEEARGIQAGYERGTAGENAGRIPVVNSPGRVERVGDGPQEMALDTILDRPEAGVCSILGVNPMVIGLAVGAQMRSYANQREAEQQSWNNGLIPTQDAMAEESDPQLLGEWGDDPAALSLGWDRSRVESLKPPPGERATEATTLYQGGIARRNEARVLVGLPPDPDGDVYVNEVQAPVPEPEPGPDPADDAEADPSDESENNDA